MISTADRVLTGSRVLVTGADGFIASHLVERLLGSGARVYAIVRPTSSTHGAPNRLRRLGAKAVQGLEECISCDIASADFMRIIERVNPELIYHLAAAAYVPYSFEHSLEVAQANVVGTLHVLEASRRCSRVQRVVCTSSSEVYGTALAESIDELHPLNPSSPYAASKVAADRYCFAYHETYGTPVAIVRPFNTYGPRHTYDVVPRFIHQALGNDALCVYGDGKQERDLMFVDDTVSAFVMMGTRPEAVGRAVNFGTGISHPILDVARNVIRLAGSSSQVVFGPARRAEVARLRCNPALAKKLFGWSARVSLHEGLLQNIQWARG